MAGDGASLEYHGTQAGVLNPGQGPNPFCLAPGPAGGRRQAGKRRQRQLETKQQLRVS